MENITIKNGEGKWLQFTITKNGEAEDLSSATFKFGVKEKYSDASYIIEKTDADFNKTNANIGVVKVNITATETASGTLDAGEYICELKIIKTANQDVDKSMTMLFIVEDSVIHD